MRSKIRKTVWTKLGLRLRQERQKRQLNNKDAGGLLGLGGQAWWKVERGITLLNAWQLRTICRAWGLSADELLALSQDDEALEVEVGGRKLPSGRANIGTPSSSSRATNSPSDRSTT